MDRRKHKEDHDAKTTAQRTPPNTLFSTSAFASALRRLLDQTTLDQSADGPALRQARRLCGRWLVVRRLAIGLDAAVAAERMGVGAEALHLLELGLVDERMLPEQARDLLITSLAGVQHDEDWVAVVIDSALGRRDARAQPIITRVQADLALLEREDGANR